MVRTRSQLENLSKEELRNLLAEDISCKLSHLTSRFDDFLRRYEILSSELSINKTCNHILSERIVQLERNTVNNAQYHCCDSQAINPVPASISNKALETNICKSLSLTGHEVKHNNCQACHRLKKGDCDC